MLFRSRCLLGSGRLLRILSTGHFGSKFRRRSIDHRYSHVFPQVFALFICTRHFPVIMLYALQNSNTFLVSFLWTKDDAHFKKTAPDSAGTYFFAALGLLAPYLERACFLLATPAVSRVPRIMWYLVPGKSFTLPPRTRTTLCSCRLCPSPGI